MPIRADGEHYFGEDNFPVAVRRIYGNKDFQHQHDLTEVKHVHNFCELVVVTEGTGVQWIDGMDFPVMAGDVFLLQGKKQHYFKERNKLALLNVMFDLEHLSLPMVELKKIPGYHAMFILEPSYRERHKFESRLHLSRIALAHCEALILTIKEECDKKELGHEAALLGMIVELMVYLSRQYSETNTTSGQALLRVGKVIAKLESDYKRQWKLEELAKIAFMSENNLLLVFKDATGRTPIDYLLRIRIQKAMEMLFETNLNISEIAENVGFSDSNYFSRCFKKFANITPRAYRRLPGIHQK